MHVADSVGSQFPDWRLIADSSVAASFSCGLTIAGSNVTVQQRIVTYIPVEKSLNSSRNARHIGAAIKHLRGQILKTCMLCCRLTLQGNAEPSIFDTLG